MQKSQVLHERLADRRCKKVIFLSHCILNENVRYPGGACRAGCVREIVEGCLDNDLGMVQMPCPEQYAWGGVSKRWLLMTYGTKGTSLYRLRRLFLPLAILYTKLIYHRIAKATADQIKDYLGSGYTVIGVLGIDGSPSCGVNTTLDFEKSFELTASMEVDSVTVEQMNAIVRAGLTNGKGLFSDALQKELRKRQIDLPYGAHDLIAELSGQVSSEFQMLSTLISMGRGKG